MREFWLSWPKSSFAANPAIRDEEATHFPPAFRLGEAQIDW